MKGRIGVSLLGTKIELKLATPRARNRPAAEPETGTGAPHWNRARARLTVGARSHDRRANHTR